MSLFSSLFGSGTTQLNKSAAEAERRLAQGRAQAEAALGQGRTDINSNYDRAQQYYDSAAPGLRNDLNAGFGAADGYLERGYGSAVDAVNAGVSDANRRLDPFVQSGLGAQGLYDKAIGVGGADASKDFYANYAANDPFRSFRDDQAQRDLERRYNATGGFQGGNGGGSGRFATASARASLERGTQDLNGYLDRLERSGARGGQYAGQQGSNSMAGGSQVGQLRAGEGTARATNAANQGSALAGLGLNLADRSAGLSTGRGGALAGLSSQLSNLAYGYGQQSAANEINLGNALNTARARPGQTLIGLGGLALSAMGGPMGGLMSGMASKGLSSLTGGYNAGSMSGLGGSLAMGNYGNVGQSAVPAGGQMPTLGAGISSFGGPMLNTLWGGK